ncbi:MAG: hypothetical protein K8I27_09260 [Planctomycetes bacterium]|nr:hypothetical protein [Planctomycetota bacterium]
MPACLQADGPETEVEDWMSRARGALARGGDDALPLATRALKADPQGADENLQMSFALFWGGHFEDSARYMRRAVNADRNLLLARKALSNAMPANDAGARLVELGQAAEGDAELCFLAGTMLLIDQDRTRALAFLVRAEELAGTDAQAAILADPDAEDRNRLRGEAALVEGDWSDAVRSFTFAALDAPTIAEHYAGVVIALSASGDDDGALKIADTLYARYRPVTLLPWLKALDVPPQLLLAAAKRFAEGPGVKELRLGALLYFAGSWYQSARETGVRALLHDKLDDFVHDLHGYMEEQGLSEDPEPVTTPGDTEVPPETPEEPAPTEATLEDARKQIRRGAFTDALKILDGFVSEDAAPAVYHLVFVATVGRGELTDALTALQAWFERVDDAERTRVNALRELFASAQLFDQWRQQITLVRDANPNQGLPRLLNTYVEITRGRFSSARTELVVAKIETPMHALVLGFDRILAKESFQNDRTPDGVLDDPSPKALLGRADRLFRDGDYEGSRGAYLKAMEADPTLPFLTLGLLRCYFALGDYDSAARRLTDLFKEQEMEQKEARDFVLLLDVGYDNLQKFEEHVAALKQECDERLVSTTPWLLYGVIQLTRTNTNYVTARDALKVWYDNDRSKVRDPILVKLYEYARRRAS